MEKRKTSMRDIWADDLQTIEEKDTFCKKHFNMTYEKFQAEFPKKPEAKQTHEEP